MATSRKAGAWGRSPVPVDRQHRASSSVPCERSEWLALAWPLGLLLAAFGAGWWYTVQVRAEPLGWPVAIPYGIALGWLARALVGWICGSGAAMDGRALAEFRHRHFWSRPARWSYAAVLVCDGMFLLDMGPDSPGLFFLFAGLAALFAIEVGVLSIALGAFHFL